MAQKGCPWSPSPWNRTDAHFRLSQTAGGLTWGPGELQEGAPHPTPLECHFPAAMSLLTVTPAGPRGNPQVMLLSCLIQHPLCEGYPQVTAQERGVLPPWQSGSGSAGALERGRQGRLGPRTGKVDRLAPAQGAPRGTLSVQGRGRVPTPKHQGWTLEGVQAEGLEAWPGPASRRG